MSFDLAASHPQLWVRQVNAVFLPIICGGKCNYCVGDLRMIFRSFRKLSRLQVRRLPLRSFLL